MALPAVRLVVILERLSHVKIRHSDARSYGMLHAINGKAVVLEENPRGDTDVGGQLGDARVASARLENLGQSGCHAAAPMARMSRGGHRVLVAHMRVWRAAHRLEV